MAVAEERTGGHIVPVSKTGKFNIEMYFSVREHLVFHLMCVHIKRASSPKDWKKTE